MNNKKIFNIPSVTRDEPKVLPSTSISKIEKTDISTEIIQDYADRIRLLTLGYDALINDYYKLINVLISRSEKLGICLDVKTRFKNDNALQQALVTIYGTSDMECISYSDFIELLKYEQSLSSAYLGTAVNIDNAFDDIDKHLLKNISSNPILGAIGQIKKEYTKYLKENDNENFLRGEQLVQRITEAESALSALSETDKTDDGHNITDDNYQHDSDKEDAIFEWMKDCIPCHKRSAATLEDFQKNKWLDLYLETFFKRMIVSLRFLIASKLSILGNYFSSELCRVIQLLGNIHCVPDLKTIIAMLNIMVLKYKKLIEAEYDGMSIGLPSGPMSVIVNSAVDALLMLLERLLRGIFSSAECLLTSMQLQLSKLDASDDINLLLSNLGIDATVEYDLDLYKPGSFKDAAEDLLFTLYDSKDTIENMFTGLIDQITKKIKINIYDGENVSDLLDNIEKFKRYISLTQEIISIVEKSSASKESGFWNKAADGICQTAFSNMYPWMEFLIRELDMPDEGTDNDDTGGDDDKKVRTNKDRTADEKSSLVMEDTSIPKDFFDDDSIDIIDDEKFIDIYDNIKWNTSSEDDEEILKLDLDKLRKYKDLKSRILSTKKNIENDLSNSDELKGLPSARLNFYKCLQSNDLTEFSNDQIEEWISKIQN